MMTHSRSGLNALQGDDIHNGFPYFANQSYLAQDHKTTDPGRLYLASEHLDMRSFGG